MPRPHAHAPSLWPREHGAYVQLMAPLSAMLFVHPSLASIAWACMAGALFLLHEPVLVLLGRRGQRVRTTLARPAQLRLALLAAIVLVTFALGVWSAPDAAPWLAVPALLSAICAWLMFVAREKTVFGQLTVSSTLTSFALPPLLAAGVATPLALAFVAAFASMQALSALTARGSIYRKQDHGQLLAWAMASALVAILGFAALQGWPAWPRSWSLAPWPFALITLVLFARLVVPRSPKSVGWALALASVVSIALFGVGLSGA